MHQCGEMDNYLYLLTYLPLFSFKRISAKFERQLVIKLSSWSQVCEL